MINSNIPQLSEEWYTQRVGRITGSRVGAILGHSKWQSADDVLRAMVREYHGAESEFTGNPATRHGLLYERQAMLAFMRETGLAVEDMGFIPYGDLLGASPDGITEDGGVLEIKVPFGLRDKSPAPFKTLAEQPHYAAQVQLEMLASDKTHAYFVQYVPSRGDVFAPDHVGEQITIERVNRDEHWLDRHKPALDAFYNRYKSELKNPEHLEPLRKVVDSEEALELVNTIKEQQDIERNAAEKRKELMNQLVELIGENALIGDAKLTKVVRRGTVQYARLIKELNVTVDLDEWRGPESVSWRLS